jgi:hypothetical protein
VDDSKLDKKSAVSRPTVGVGGNVTMTCGASGEGSVRWLRIRFDTAEQSKIYEEESVAHQYTEKFQAVADGNHSLTLIDARMSDNGWYVCGIGTGRRNLEQTRHRYQCNF